MDKLKRLAGMWNHHRVMRWDMDIFHIMIINTLCIFDLLLVEPNLLFINAWLGLGFDYYLDTPTYYLEIFVTKAKKQLLVNCEAFISYY